MIAVPTKMTIGECASSSAVSIVGFPILAGVKLVQANGFMLISMMTLSDGERE